MKKFTLIMVLAFVLFSIGCSVSANSDTNTAPKKGADNVELEWYGEYLIQGVTQESIRNTVFSTLQSACSTSDVKCTDGWSQRKIRATLTQKYIQICIHNPESERDITSGCVQKDLPTPPEDKRNTEREVIKLIPEFGKDFADKFRSQTPVTAPSKAQK